METYKSVVLIMDAMSKVTRMFVVGCLLLLAISNVFAQTPAITIDKTITLYENANGKVLSVMPPNSALTLLAVEGEWAEVRWQPSGDPSKQLIGWLDSASIEVTGSSALNSAIRRNFIAKSQDCAWSRAGKGKVCVDTRDAILDCRKSATDEFWRRCEVSVSYALFAELKQPQNVNSNVKCDIDIEYKLADSFDWQKQEDKKTQLHSIEPNQHIEYALKSLFDFSDFEQVTNVKIEKLDCEIDVLP
jgi:hypothetical protein